MDFCLGDAIGVGLGSGGVEPGAVAKHGVEIRAGEHPHVREGSDREYRPGNTGGNAKARAGWLPPQIN